MIRAGLVLWALLFVATMATLVMMISASRTYTKESLRHEELLRGAAERAASDPDAAAEQRQEADALGRRLQTMDTRRMLSFRALWVLAGCLVLLGFALGAGISHGVFDARRNVTPGVGRVLDVRETRRSRQGCPEVVVELEVARPGQASVTGTARVYLCDRAPAEDDGATYIPRGRVRAGAEIPVRFNPAFGGIVKLVADDFE